MDDGSIISLNWAVVYGPTPPVQSSMDDGPSRPDDRPNNYFSLGSGTLCL